MKEYIFGERNGIYIIDLDKTVVMLEEAYKALFTIVKTAEKYYSSERESNLGKLSETKRFAAISFMSTIVGWWDADEP